MARIQCSITIPVADFAEAEAIKPKLEAVLAENGWKNQEDSASYTYLEEI